MKVLIQDLPDSRHWDQVYPAKLGVKPPLTDERLVVMKDGDAHLTTADQARTFQAQGNCSGIFAPVSHF